MLPDETERMKKCHDDKTVVLYMISAWIISSLCGGIILYGLVVLGKLKISSEKSYSGRGDGSGIPCYN